MIRDPDNYAAAGLTLNLPLFAGGLYYARQKEAELRAKAADESVRDAENNAIRDVRIAWLNARNASIVSASPVSCSKTPLAPTTSPSHVTKWRKLHRRTQPGAIESNRPEIEYENTKYEYLVRLSALNFQVGSLH